MVSIQGLAEAVIAYDVAMRAGVPAPSLYTVMVERARAEFAPAEDEDAEHCIRRRIAKLALLAHSEVRTTFVAAIHSLMARGDTSAAMHRVVDSAAASFVTERLRHTLEEVLLHLTMPAEEMKH